jgi:PAS domain S-box-containing protein
MSQSQGERDFAVVRLAVDYAIVHILADAATLDEAGPRILSAIGETCGWELGALWEVEDSVLLRCAATWEADPEKSKELAQASRRVGLAPGVGLPGRVWASGEPAWIEDISADANFPRAHAAAAASLRCAFAFPIKSGAKTVGVIEFFTPQPRTPDPQLLEMMEIAGTQIGQYIERKHAEDEIRQSEALKTAIIESAMDAFVMMDHEGKIVEFNPAAERTFGYAREDVIGREMAGLLIPPYLRERHKRGLARFLAGGDAPIFGKRIELTGMRSDGSEFPVELTIDEVTGSQPPVFSGFIRDITRRRGNEDALKFLVEATAALDTSLDLDTIAQTLAHMTVPYLADGCMVDVLEEGGTIRRVGAAAADPSYEPVLHELQRHRIRLEGPHPIARVMRTGRTEIIHDISDTFLREISETEEYHQALQRWPARSIVIAPIKARGRLHGTMSLASFSPERPYGLEQISVIEEVAARAANAVDNARLFGERSRMAHGLEQSLLPPHLPVVPGIELAARFQPARGGGEVGGDFYDVFDAGDAGWAIAIGDVSGRGVDAAATTVLARHTLRAAAMQEHSPSRILMILNEALRSHSDDLMFCSAALGFLRLDNGRAELTLATGGHPLPLLLHAEGEVEPVGQHGTLLGVLAQPTLNDREIRLEEGDSIVFYTNGVAELRALERGYAPDKLIKLVARCGRMDAMTTVECIDEAVRDAHRGEPQDDAAIVVAKLR